MESKVRLFPCPFCGLDYDLTTVLYPSYSKNGVVFHRISCKTCGSSGPAGRTDVEASLFWNSRGTTVDVAHAIRDIYYDFPDVEHKKSDDQLRLKCNKIISNLLDLGVRPAAVNAITRNSWKRDGVWRISDENSNLLSFDEWANIVLSEPHRLDGIRNLGKTYKKEVINALEKYVTGQKS